MSGRLSGGLNSRVGFSQLPYWCFAKCKFNTKKFNQRKQQNNHEDKNDTRERSKASQRERSRNGRNNICITGIPEEEKQNSGIELLFKSIIQENIPETGNDLNLYIIKGSLGT